MYFLCLRKSILQQSVCCWQRWIQLRRCRFRRSNNRCYPTTSRIPISYRRQRTKNPSFETYERSLSIETIDLQNICNLSTDFIPKFWFLTTGSWSTILTSNRNLARDGRSFLFIRGNVKQEIVGLQLGGLYCVEFFSSQFTGSEALVSNREWFVSFGKIKHVHRKKTHISVFAEMRLSATFQWLKWAEWQAHFSDNSVNCHCLFSRLSMTNQ